MEMRKLAEENKKVERERTKEETKKRQIKK